MVEPLPLLHDLAQGALRRDQVGDRDDPAGAAVVQRVRHLPGRITLEQGLVAELGGQQRERLVDRPVELPDRGVALVLRRTVTVSRPLDRHKPLDGLA